MRALALCILAAAAVFPGRPLAQAAPGELAFGMVGPFSGSARALGYEMKTGIDVAFAAVNAAGGVHGRRLRLVAMDDAYDPARTGAALRELLDAKKVFGFVGNVGSAPGAVSAQFASDKGVLLFAPLSGASLLRNDPPDRFVFNYRPSYAEETAAIVRHLVEVRRIPADKIAVLAQDDAYGEAGLAGVARAVRRYRVDPASVLRVSYRRGTADVDEAVKTVKRHAASLKAVVLIATYKPAARFIEKLRDAGVDLVFTNVSFVGSNDLAEELTQLGPRYAEGVVVTQVVPSPLARATALLDYQEQLKRYAPGEKPGYVSLEGWIAARLLVEGLRRAGPDPTTDRLVAALEAIQGLDAGVGVPLTFGPSEHQASHKVWGTVMDGKGAFQPIELE
jgi:branched-chain amino acid transport system substrate-binding protein